MHSQLRRTKRPRCLLAANSMRHKHFFHWKEPLEVKLMCCWWTDCAVFFFPLLDHYILEYSGMTPCRSYSGLAVGPEKFQRVNSGSQRNTCQPQLVWRSWSRNSRWLGQLLPRCTGTAKRIPPHPTRMALNSVTIVFVENHCNECVQNLNIYFRIPDFCLAWAIVSRSTKRWRWTWILGPRPAVRRWCKFVSCRAAQFVHVYLWRGYVLDLESQKDRFGLWFVRVLGFHRV